MSHNLCIIEDEIDIADALKEYFEGEGFNVSAFYNGMDFLRNEGTENFDGFYLVDWNLPDIQGIDIVKKIRETNKLSPVFMVTAYSKKEDIINGLKAGADDYITKPFNFEELLQRVRNSALKKEAMNEKIGDDDGEVKLLPAAAAFLKGNTAINLTRREYIIFEKLYLSNGECVTREQLIDCFEKEDKMTIRNIDVHIFSLRKKIKEVCYKIDTVWGLGYKLSMQL